MPNTAREMKDITGTAAPKVSVIIPLYNHEHYAREAVCSVLGQTFEDFELIIINDGSTDKSEEVVRGISDKRIKYLCQDNRGAANTINRGVQLARGGFVSILNSDDMYDTHRLEECVKILENDRSISAVFSYLEFIDGEGKFIKYLRGAEENWADHEPETSFKGEHNIVLDLLAGNFLTTTSNLFCRKDAFDTLGNFSNLRYAHDYDFFLRLCHQQKVHIIEKPLAKYRIHNLNTIKENESAVDFEVGLVLANFFLNYDVHRYFEGKNGLYESMMKFLSSINTYNADRMLVVLLLFGMKYPEIRKDILTLSLENHADAFKRVCIGQLKKINEGWSQWHETNDRLIAMEKELLEGWTQWRETNDRLIAMEKEFREGWTQWRETNERLVAKDKELPMGWEQWRETNERLVSANGQLVAVSGQLDAANQQIIEKGKYIQALLNSRSYRLGRLLTWPLRKLLGRN